MTEQISRILGNPFALLEDTEFMELMTGFGAGNLEEGLYDVTDVVEDPIISRIRAKFSGVPENYRSRLCIKAMNGQCDGVTDAARFYHRCQENPQGNLGCVYFQLNGGGQ